MCKLNWKKHKACIKKKNAVQNGFVSNKYEKNPVWNAFLFESKIYIYTIYHLVSPMSVHLYAILKKQFNMFNTKYYFTIHSYVI